jgi:transposase-like protein
MENNIKLECPKCGKTEGQIKKGFNRSGTQRCMCKNCNIIYTPEPKLHTIPEEKRNIAIKMYYGGRSARGVAKILGFSKNNVINWIKKKQKNWRKK